MSKFVALGFIVPLAVGIGALIWLGVRAWRNKDQDRGFMSFNSTVGFM